MKNGKESFKTLVALWLFSWSIGLNATLDAASLVPAFPGAEGYGAKTLGGRGGRVIAVTNLNDSGPGSLREAVAAKGPRIVVFRVSGTIRLEDTLSIRNPFITIAGQSAPGEGICLRDFPLAIDADDVVIRYIRVRLGDASEKDSDAIGSRGHENIILDHCSMSWSIDETLSIYHCRNVTVQWCLISESLYNSHHAKGRHGYGGIWGSDYSSYHHNLFAHHSSRNPRFASGSGHVDYRNNVIYNWGFNSAYGGEKVQVGSEVFTDTFVNMVANYYKPGPATRNGPTRYRIVSPSSRDGADDFGKWYVADNVMVGSEVVTLDNWDGGVQPGGGDAMIPVLKLEEPWDSLAIRTQTAEAAYRAVLETVGASAPARDAIDRRIVEEVQSGTATFGGGSYSFDRDWDKDSPSGIIDSQSDVGGWPELKGQPAPEDRDGDGMPDGWEEHYGLDPRNGVDGSRDLDNDGYTNVEEFLNGTNPAVFFDYTLPEYNINTLRP